MTVLLGVPYAPSCRRTWARNCSTDSTDIGLLVAGDVVYNGVHLYLTESGGAEGIEQWLAALDIAEALSPATVIAGHKDPRAGNDPSQIQDTRRYLTDARRLLLSSESAEEFYDEMLRRHPHRINPGALWGAAITLFPTVSLP